jgi:hypothetical protein
MIGTILLVFAFVLACLASGVPYGDSRNWPWSMGWAAMAFYFLSLLLGGLFPHTVVR